MNPANRRANARDQFARAEGLGNVVVRAKFQRLNLFFFAVAHRQHQHRQPRSKRADAAQRFDSADARHVDVEQHHVVSAGMQQLQRLFSARCFAELKSKLGQRRPQRAADRGFIIDDKNANGGLIHYDSLFRAWAGMAAKNVVAFILVARDPDISVVDRRCALGHRQTDAGACCAIRRVDDR